MTAPLRSTRQRTAVSALLGDLEGFRSTKQIHQLLCAQGDAVGLSTVYRTLQAMADAGELDVIKTEDESLYRKCSASHHHHLVCRGCGRTEEVEGPTVERWADRVAAEHDFADVSHTLEIFGSCAGCRR
ncbi:MAG: transcriptional repressor [Geodermatophilaceae bacterium]|nr:transcriptional repressor [Geodermatophilaceae bacterium]